MKDNLEMLLRLENFVTSSLPSDENEIQVLEEYFLKTSLMAGCPCNQDKVVKRLKDYWVVRGQSELLSLNN